MYKHIYLLLPKLSQAVVFLASHHLPCLIFSSPPPVLVLFLVLPLYLPLRYWKRLCVRLRSSPPLPLANRSPHDPSYLLSIESSLLLLVLCNRTETWRIDERCWSWLSSTSLDAGIFTTHQRFTQLPSKPYEATNVEILARDLRPKHFPSHFYWISYHYHLSWTTVLHEYGTIFFEDGGIWPRRKICNQIKK